MTINADIIVALENSDIIANAFEGNGGQFKLRAKAFLARNFRPALTPDSDITASSEFGLSGTVLD
jgi:large exoprotein involved in heme utilization and adhesion